MRSWLVTGGSSGLGKAIAQTVMEQGEFVIATFRKQAQAEKFCKSFPGKGFGIVLDLSDPETITKSFSLIKEKFNKIDVLVNNAGYGFAGAIEESTLEECRAVFETNLFGTLQVTQHALAMMRSQKNGRIIQISSHGGFKAFAGFGIYNASKFALEGFSEALAEEAAHLGIRVTIVQPGPFRTHFAGKGFVSAAKVIDDYKETAGAFRNKIKAVDGKQEGDPLKSAKAIYDVSKLQNPPMRLPLGKIAIGSILQKIESVKTDLDRFKAVAEQSVF